MPLCHFRLSQQPDPEYPISRSQRSHALATHTHTRQQQQPIQISIPYCVRTEVNASSSLLPPLVCLRFSGKKVRVDHEMNEPTEFVGNRSGGRRDPSAFFSFLLLCWRARRLNHPHTLGTWYYYGTAKWRARRGKGFANYYFKNGISSTQYDIYISALKKS